MGIWPVLRSTQWVRISTFLETQEFFQEAKMKDVCTGGYWGIICQWKSGPYLTSVQASCQSEDLEKRHNMACFLCVIPLLEPVLSTLAIASLKLSAIFSAAVCILPSRVRVNPRYLKWVTSSRGVPSYVKVGIAEVSLLKKTMVFVLSVLSLSPLKRV